MSHLIIQQVEKKLLKAELPEIKAGYTVKVHQKIKEGEKERIQIYEGLVIAMNHGHGHNKTMIVRKVVEGIGVEKIFPLHSPNIAKIEVVRTGKVRRAKLYYMRDISGKAARLKEVLVSHGHKDKTVKAAKATKAEPAVEVETPVETAPSEVNESQS
jgi:large subunit ribosomal protein L19